MEIDIKPGVTGQNIAPQMPIEPPKEVKDMIFTFDPELMGKGGETTITTDKGVEIKEDRTPVTEVKPTEEISVVKPPKEETPTKSVEASKEEVKPKEETVKKQPESVLKPPASKQDEKPVKSDTKPAPVIKPISPVRDEKDEFDFSKYAPHEVLNMKNMSRQSREAYAKLIDENKQLASLKDASYLQHEQAYILSPEYQQLTTQAQNVSSEGQAWERALLAIKAGKPYQEPVGRDKSGNLIFGPERAATDADEIRISNNYSLCASAYRESVNKIQNYGPQFKSRIQQDLQQIDQVERSNFAWVQDPKLMEHTVDIEGIGAQSLAQIRDNFISVWPSYMRNLRPVQVAANLMIALQIRNAELKEARNGQQIATIKQAEATRGEPTSVERALPDSDKKLKGVPSVFTLDGYPVR